MQITETMYHAVGGDAGLTQLVDRFYVARMVRSRPEELLRGESTEDSISSDTRRSFLTFALGGGA
jgi:truncated hemoglobin YjbI